MVPRLAVTTRRRLVSELDACTPRRIKRLGPVRSQRLLPQRQGPCGIASRSRLRANAYWFCHAGGYANPRTLMTVGTRSQARTARVHGSRLHLRVVAPIERDDLAAAERFGSELRLLDRCDLRQTTLPVGVEDLRVVRRERGRVNE